MLDVRFDYTDLAITGWIAIWKQDGVLIASPSGALDREGAEIEACGAAFLDTTNSFVIPVYDWSSIHPLLAYKR